MKAIVVKPGVKDSASTCATCPIRRCKPDQVAVKMLRVGLCGTDAEINHGLYGKPPDGDEFLILGHENFGVVEDVGKKVKGWKAGDLVVSTVRRPCGVCPMQGTARTTCAAAASTPSAASCGATASWRSSTSSRRGPEQDPERDPRLRGAARADVGRARRASTTPSCCSSGSRAGSRRFGMVLGAGPIGLLAAAVLRARGLRVARRRPRDPSDDCARSWSSSSAPTYVCVANKRCPTCRRKRATPTSSSRRPALSRVVFDAMEILGSNGVLCLLRSPAATHEPRADRLINQRLVLGNQVVFGSVNANPRHFAGREGFRDDQQKVAGAARQLITTRLPWREYKKGCCTPPASRRRSRSAGDRRLSPPLVDQRRDQRRPAGLVATRRGRRRCRRGSTRRTGSGRASADRPGTSRVPP